MSPKVKFTGPDEDGRLQVLGYITLDNGNLILEPRDSMLLTNIVGTSDRYASKEEWFNHLPDIYHSPYLMATMVEDSSSNSQSKEAGGRESVSLDWPASASASESTLATGPRSMFNQRTHKEP